MKRYLNEAEKYEIWKKKFTKEMSNFLAELFWHWNIGCYIAIQKVDKWNIQFNISGGTVALTRLDQRIHDDPTLADILKTNSNININSNKKERDFVINAKTQEELDVQLGYLKMVFA